MSIDIGSGERGKFIFTDDGLVPESQFVKTPKTQHHTVLPDEMPPLQSMAVAYKCIFTSRSAYKRHLKEHGFVETGGEHLKDLALKELEAMRPEYQEARRKEMQEITRKAINAAKYDEIEFTEKQKELFKREKEAWNRIKKQ